MAYIECDMSSLSSGGSATLSTSSTRVICYYGSLFGATGYWIRLPGMAPPIGEMPTTLSTPGWGACIEIEGSTTGAAWGAQNKTRTPLYLTIAAYRQGTRWFRITNTGLHLLMKSGIKRKKLKAWYREANALVPPSL